MRRIWPNEGEKGKEVTIIKDMVSRNRRSSENKGH